jgi:hypothetical protein
MKGYPGDDTVINTEMIIGVKRKMIPSGKVFYRSRPIHACSDMNKVCYFRDDLPKNTLKIIISGDEYWELEKMKEKVNRTRRSGF